MVSHVLVVRQGHGMYQGGCNGAGPWRGLHVQRLPVLPLRALQIRVLVNKRINEQCISKQLSGKIMSKITIFPSPNQQVMNTFESEVPHLSGRRDGAGVPAGVVEWRGVVERVVGEEVSVRAPVRRPRPVVAAARPTRGGLRLRRHRGRHCYRLHAALSPPPHAGRLETKSILLEAWI